MSGQRSRYQRTFANRSDTGSNDWLKRRAARRVEAEPDRAGEQSRRKTLLQRAHNAPRRLTAQDVLHLQRTIGNQAVTRLLEQKTVAQSGKPEHGNRIQRKTVAVAGGEFKDDVIGGGYRASNEDESDVTGTYTKVGAKIELAFVPKPGLEAEQVSLVQTTNSTVQNTTNPQVPDQSHSLLGERRTESGTAIDQEIYLSNKSVKSGTQRWATDQLLPLFQTMDDKGQQDATNQTIKKYITFFTTGGGAGNNVVKMLGINPSAIMTNLNRILQNEGNGVAAEIRDGVPKLQNIMEAQAKSINLDPRYSEERRNTGGSLKAPRAPGQEVGSGGWTAVKQDGVWVSNAALRDAPGHKIAQGDQVNGREQFETTAMADGNKFIGSIRWGYNVANSISTLDPAQIELVNYGSASNELFKAAKQWNNMQVPDTFNEDLKHRTMQLPESDQAKQSAKTAFELRRWMSAEETMQVMEALGRETIEVHYGATTIGRIRKGVDSVEKLVSLVVKLTEVRGPDAVKSLGEASDEYSDKGYKMLCAKSIDEIVKALYTPKSN
ncbi:MAG: hypothetical protein ACYDBJ_21540 [Aggregatilineales bacterium]